MGWSSASITGTPFFKAGRVGHWTEADSITAFDDVVVRGVSGKP